MGHGESQIGYLANYIDLYRGHPPPRPALTLPFLGTYVSWGEELMDDRVLDISPDLFLVGGVALRPNPHDS